MATKRKGLPPYLSYRTFRSFIDSVSVGGVPNRIDRSMMASMSGSNQALLVSAIRYLGLASEKGVSTPELESLVNAEGKERQEIWRRILSRAYSNLFNSRINLERATTKELSEVFAKEGVSSADTIRKCVTFFSLAAKAFSKTKKTVGYLSFLKLYLPSGLEMYLLPKFILAVKFALNK